MSCLQWFTQFLSLFFFHLYFPSLSSNLSSSHVLCQLDQRHALLQFKNSFSITSSASVDNSPFDDDAPYPKTDSWGDDSDCCLWEGVTCDLQTGYVIGLHLSSSMLFGSFHSNNSLFLLSHLQFLDLSNNDFNYSTISPQFGGYFNLRYLYLNSSNFEGQVPLEISYLSNLVSLDISGNPLTLEATTFNRLAQNLTEFRELDMSHVNMSLVEPISLMNLSSFLSSLKLEDCGLRGDFSGNLLQRPNLRVVDLRRNHDLSGCLPRSNWSRSLEILEVSYTKIAIYLDGELISNLRSVKILGFSGYSFVGSNISLFGDLRQLSELYLSSNNFSGYIPSTFRNLKHLTVLFLSSNNFSGYIPSTFWNLQHLIVLDLSSNNFSGHIGHFQYNSFYYINLRNNKLEGAIPSSICKLKQLRFLNLYNNSFSSFIPCCLGNFSSDLMVLNLGMNSFQGSIPTLFSKVNSLRYVNLHGNQLVGQIPPSITNCKNLEVLDIGCNKIDDTFPAFLESLPKLRVLVLRSNRLHGVLLGAIANYSFSKLRILDMSNNNLSGPLPLEYFSRLKAMIISDESFGYMGNQYGNYEVEVTWKGWEIELNIQTKFTTIDLSANKFTGNIPWSIGKLQSLKQLNLSHNYFTGNIPPLLGKLRNVESLDLSSNMLSGKIPMELVDLIFLSVFRISHNELEGHMPLGKQFNTFDTSSYEGNSGLYGFPLKKACEEGEREPVALLEDDSESENGFGWKAVLLGYGCGFVFGFTMAYQIFRTRRPLWVVKMFEDKTKTYRCGRRNQGTS